MSRKPAAAPAAQSESHETESPKEGQGVAAASVETAAEAQPEAGTAATVASADTASPLITQEGKAIVADGQRAEVASDVSDAGDTEQADTSSEHDADAPYGRRADGTPAKKRGRPAASVSDERDTQRAKLRSVTPSKHKPTPRPGEAAAQVTALAVVNYQAMGENVANAFFSVGTLAFGTDWQPNIEEGEHLAVAGAFRDYFKATGMRDLPPGFALVFVLSIYTLKRAAKPNVAQKLKGFGAWIRSKIPTRR